jgi:hypothetical protein
MTMRTWQKMVAGVSDVMILAVAFSLAAFAGGPPLQEKSGGSWPKDDKIIMPKNHPDVSGAMANKFSTASHKAHQGGGKTTGRWWKCTDCHVNW